MSMFRIVVAVSAFCAAVAERAYDENTPLDKGEGKEDPDETALPAQMSAHFTCDADNEELSSCANTQFSDDDHAETCWADEARQDCDKDSQGAYDLVMVMDNSYCTYKALVKLGTFQGVTCKAVPADQDAGDDAEVSADAKDARQQEVKDYMRDQIKSKLGGEDARQQEVKDYMRDQIKSKLGGEDARQQEVKDYMRDQIKSKLGGEDARQQEVKDYMRGQIKSKLGGEDQDAGDDAEVSADAKDGRQQEVKDYMRDQIQSKLGGEDARQQEVKNYMRDQIKSKLGGEDQDAGDDAEVSADAKDQDAGDDAEVSADAKDRGAVDDATRAALEGLIKGRQQHVKDYMRDQIQSKIGAQDDDSDPQAHVKKHVKEQIQKKLAEKDGRQQEVKNYIRDQIKSKLGGEEEEDADAEAYSGDPEDLEGGDMSAIEDLEKDLAAMNEFHDHDELMRKELEGLDLMDETVVEELGKYSEDLAKCMFRCIHSAHRYFSAEDAAKEACQCTKSSSGGICDECQYLPDDKIKDEEGNPIEVESAHASGHLSEKHFQGKSSRGRCVLPGEVADARKINFRGTVIQC